MLPRGNAQIAVLKIIVRALDTSLVTFWTGTGLLLVLGSHGMTMFTESVVAAANEPTKRRVRLLGFCGRYAENGDAGFLKIDRRFCDNLSYVSRCVLGLQSQKYLIRCVWHGSPSVGLAVFYFFCDWRPRSINEL